MNYNLKDKSGIYKITNSMNSAFYVGSAYCIYSRLHCHFSQLKANKHANNHLQHIYNKHGRDNLKYEVLEFCEKEALIEREQYYIDNLKPTLNICKQAANTTGFKFNPAQLKHLSDVRKGVYPEHLKGTNNTPDARKKISEKQKEFVKRNGGLHKNFMAASIKANKGRKHTQEEIKKRVDKQKKISPEQSVIVKDLYAAGVFQKDIAIKFNCTQRVINKVIHGGGVYGTEEYTNIFTPEQKETVSLGANLFPNDGVKPNRALK